MKTYFTLLALALASLSTFAADISGTWKAGFNTQRGLREKNVPHIWHVDDHARDFQHWKKALYQFSQLLFKPTEK